jgi:hypothetical protein
VKHKKHIEGQGGSDGYFVFRTKIKTPGSLAPCDLEIIDCLLLALDNYASGGLQEIPSVDYLGDRLIELGTAMKKA